MAKKRKRLSKLDRAVNAAIAQQVAPYSQGLREASSAFNANQSYSNKANSALQGELGSLAGGYGEHTGSLLNLAADRSTASGSDLAAQQAFLQNSIGPGITGVGQQAISNRGSLIGSGDVAANQQLASELALRQSSFDADNQLLSGAAGMRNREFIDNARLERNARKKALQNKIKSIKSSRPALRREMYLENLDAQLAKQAAGLEQARLDEEMRQFDESLAFEGEQASGEGKPDFSALLGGIRTAISSGQVGKSPVARAQYALRELVAAGANTGQAASNLLKIATPNEIKRTYKTSQQMKFFWKRISNASNNTIANNIMQRVYGKGWKTKMNQSGLSEPVDGPGGVFQPPVQAYPAAPTSSGSSSGGGGYGAAGTFNPVTGEGLGAYG